MAIHSDSFFSQRAVREQVEAKRAALPATKTAESQDKFFGEDGFSFGDILDMVNPLQHLPVISGLYREITGDKIDAGPEMVGGAIFGGVVGFAASAIDSIIESETGDDVHGHIAALFGGEKNAPQQTQQLAEKTVPSQTPSPASSTNPFFAPQANVAPNTTLHETVLAAVQGLAEKDAPAPQETASEPASPQNQPTAAPAYVPVQGMPAAMMDALDKYESMAQQRHKQATYIK